MLGVVVQDAVIDLVGKEHQPVALGDTGDACQHRGGVHRSGRIVGVDHDHRPGARRDLGLDICQIGDPAGLLVAAVVHRAPAAERRDRRPQRIVGRGDQHLVAVVQQRLQRHLDQLRHAVSDVDVGHVDVLDAAAAVVGHDRLAGRHQAARIAVADRGGEVLDHVSQQVARPFETEGSRISDVQLEDPMPGSLQPQGLLQHRAAHVVGDV